MAQGYVTPPSGRGGAELFTTHGWSGCTHAMPRARWGMLHCDGASRDTLQTLIQIPGRALWGCERFCGTVERRQGRATGVCGDGVAARASLGHGPSNSTGPGPGPARQESLSRMGLLFPRISFLGKSVPVIR